jgi:putative tributyrin esterase
MWGSEVDWAYKGRIGRTVDRLRGAGRIGPMIIAMPNDGLMGDGTFYVNWQDGTGRFEDYMVGEVLPEVERALGVVVNRSRRAIAGLSMGGFGALALALRHPGLFCAAGSLSGAFEALRRPGQRALGRRIFGRAGGDYWRQHDPAWLVANRRASRRVALHINCGRADGLIEANRRLHQRLEALGVAHEYREFPGAHDWGYWPRRIVPVLEFVWRRWEALASR